MSFLKKIWLPGRAGGTPVNSADLNVLSQGIDDLYNKSAFKVYLTTTPYNVSDGSALQFNATDYDPDGLYSRAGASIWNFVCPRAGLWCFTAQYAMAGSPGALDIYYSVRMWRNGTSSNDFHEGPRTPNRGVPITVQATQYLSLVAGDLVAPFCSMGAAIPGSALLVGGASAGMPTWFGGHQVRVT